MCKQRNTEYLNVFLMHYIYCSPLALCTFPSQISAEQLNMLFVLHVRRTRCSRYKFIGERVRPEKRGNSFIMRTAEEQADLIAGHALSRRWTGDLLGSLSAWIIFNFEWIWVMSQTQPLFHQLCVMGSPCELSRTSLGNDRQKIRHQELSAVHCWESAAPIHLGAPTWGALSELLIFITHLGRCVCLMYVD